MNSKKSVSNSKQETTGALDLRVVDARFLFAFSNLEHAPDSSFPEVAFAGRSNVGKSSLLNTLMGRRNLVRTSSTPGCTRQINVFESTLRTGQRVQLADLPGFGFARRSKHERMQWGAMMEAYFRERHALKLVVILVDIRRGPEELEHHLVEFLAHVKQPPVEHLWVATKVDKLPRSSAKLAIDKMRLRAGGRLIGVSAKTAQGVEQLWRAIVAATGSFFHCES